MSTSRVRISAGTRLHRCTGQLGTAGPAQFLETAFQAVKEGKVRVPAATSDGVICFCRPPLRSRLLTTCPMPGCARNRSLLTLGQSCMALNLAPPPSPFEVEFAVIEENSSGVKTKDLAESTERGLGHSCSVWWMNVESEVMRQHEAGSH